VVVDDVMTRLSSAEEVRAGVKPRCPDAPAAGVLERGAFDPEVVKRSGASSMFVANKLWYDLIWFRRVESSTAFVCRVSEVRARMMGCAARERRRRRRRRRRCQVSRMDTVIWSTREPDSHCQAPIIIHKSLMLNCTPQGANLMCATLFQTPPAHCFITPSAQQICIISLKQHLTWTLRATTCHAISFVSLNSTKKRGRASWRYLKFLQNRASNSIPEGLL